ncbi:MAG TPA: orotidine 5'-phosphate decarboxylase [Candidatus Atribacteria bacterium]|nr:orotidine 5'-phosphate decarboxylase [Candidatus Atribacteria bacterium]
MRRSKLKPRFQLALDIVTWEKAKQLASSLLDYVDIIEVGTPLILRYGLSIVTEIKSLVGEKKVFADTKIVDAGGWETEESLRSGADMVSVLAGASFFTLQEAKEVCRERGAQLVVDTIDFFFPCPEKMKEIREVNPDFLSLHLASDAFQKGESWLEVMEKSPFLREGGYSFMVAGGISAVSLPQIMKEVSPAVVVVGSAITNSPHPEEEAREIRRIIDEFEF